VINPLRSERDAFRFFLYVLGGIVTLILLALLIQAL